MSKVISDYVAQKAIDITVDSLKNRTISYSEMDCQKFQEYILSSCGIKVDYSGSNDMYRNAFKWIGTIEEAKRLGYILPGCAVLIVSNDGKEPSKYKKDGKGNASHIGMYVGESALRDTDKNGKSRVCNVVHSSASLGRVGGSTLQNGWTHVGLWKELDYEGEIPMIEEHGETYIVTANSGSTVNLRKNPSKTGKILCRVAIGKEVTVVEKGIDWATVICDGVRGYMQLAFLTKAETNDDTVTDIDITTLLGTVIDAVTELRDTVNGMSESIEDIKDELNDILNNLKLYDQDGDID